MTVLGVPLPEPRYRSEWYEGMERVHAWTFGRSQLIAYARAVAAAQREKDARICEKPDEYSGETFSQLAAAIRSQE